MAIDVTLFPNFNDTSGTCNIIADSFSYAEIDRVDAPNVVRAMFIDSGNDDTRTVAQVEDEPDQDTRGSVIQDLDILGVNTRNQSIRLANIQLLKAKLTEFVCQFRVSINNCDVAPGDIITVTHTVPGWTSKPFRIVKLVEHQNDEIDLSCEEYDENSYSDDGQGASYIEYPEEPNPVTIRQPADVPDLHRLVWSTDSKAEWTAHTIYYKGIGYEINANSTTNAYIWFDKDVSTTELQSAAAKPTLTADQWLLAYYDSSDDTVQPAFSAKIINGQIIKAGSITADEIATGTFVASVGGNYESSAGAGARVEMFRSANQGLQVFDGGGNSVFLCEIGGAGEGDVTIGDTAVGKYLKWDDDAATFTVQGLLQTGTTGSQRVILDNTDGTLQFYDSGNKKRAQIDVHPSYGYIAAYGDRFVAFGDQYTAIWGGQMELRTDAVGDTPFKIAIGAGAGTTKLTISGDGDIDSEGFGDFAEHVNVADTYKMDSTTIIDTDKDILNIKNIDMTGALTLSGGNIDVTGNIVVSGTVDGVNVAEQAVPVPADPGDDQKVLRAAGGVFAWASTSDYFPPKDHAANAATYGYGDTTDAGHLRVGNGLKLSAAGTVAVDQPVPEPDDPGDDGKVLTANAGTFAWV